MNLVQMLKESVRRFGEKTAITHGDKHLSYAALDAASDRFAAALQTSGITKGNRIATLLSNSTEFMIVYFGAVKAGALAVPLDPKYKPAEIFSLLDDCRPRLLVGETSCTDALKPGGDRLTYYIEKMLDITPDAPGVHESLAHFTDAFSKEFIPVRIDDSDLAHIAYTSGPSFSPRGVMTPHGNLLKEIDISARSFAQTENDVVVQFALPLHHVIGLVVVMLTSLYCGSEVIILNGVSIDSLASTIERHKVTMFTGVPFIHAMLLRKLKDEGLKHSLKSLRIISSAGDILNPSTVEKYRQLLNIRLIDFYGLTETLGHVTCEPFNQPAKPGSVGPALPGWKIRIVDESSRLLPPKQPGEVIIRGPFMAGYYDKSAATAMVIRNGWLHTGDLGMIDEEGFLYMLGLQKDMLICKGQNIFPSDIEHTLILHPAVAQAAAVGVPDEMRGEVVGAALVLKPGAHTSETALTKFCLGCLANYKVPKYFSFCEALPLTPDNKVDKQAIRESFIARSRTHISQE